MTQLRAGIGEPRRAHPATVQGYERPVRRRRPINRFPNDTDEEVELVRTLSLEAGAMDAQHNTAVVDGGAGAADLARAVVKAANAPGEFKLTYADDAPIDATRSRAEHDAAEGATDPDAYARTLEGT